MFKLIVLAYSRSKEIGARIGRIIHILWVLGAPIKMYMLPGGKEPGRQTDEAIAYDVYLRAIVSAHEMDPEDPDLRKTLCDFENIVDDHLIENVRKDGNELVYVLGPGESVLVGVGFLSSMEFSMFYWVAPRSGLATKHQIQVTNAPGTVDPDYRGEAGVAVLNFGDKPFILRKHMRIAQMLYSVAIMPPRILVGKREELGKTKRGAGGFGSTGLR